MTAILKAGLATTLVVGLSAGAQAQSRVRLAAPIRAARPGVAHTVRASQLALTTDQLTGGGLVVTDSAIIPLAGLPLGTFPVPGLGFDFAHLAAITRNVKVSDVSVLSTAERLALARSLSPAVPFAVPFFSQPAQVIVVQQPPVVIVQQPAPSEEVAEPVARARPVEPRETSETPRPPEPVRDVGEFVLVRRDGKLLFAVAFFTQGDLLTYVTREGVRRSLPLAELDYDATHRMNAERGTTIRLPA